MSTEIPPSLSLEAQAAWENLRRIWTFVRQRPELSRMVTGAALFDPREGPVMVVIGPNAGSPIGTMTKLWGATRMPPSMEVLIGGPLGIVIPEEAIKLVRESGNKPVPSVGEVLLLGDLANSVFGDCIHTITAWYSAEHFFGIMEGLTTVVTTDSERYSQWASLELAKASDGRYADLAVRAHITLEQVGLTGDQSYTTLRDRVKGDLTRGVEALDVPYITRVARKVEREGLIPSRVLDKAVSALDRLNGPRAPLITPDQQILVTPLIYSLTAHPAISDAVMSRLIKGDEVPLNRAILLSEVTRLLLIREFGKK